MNCGIVENDAAYASAMSAELSSVSGVDRVLVWKSGEEFWRDSRRPQLDFCVIDIGLPGIDGVELIVMIRSRWDYPCVVDLPVVMTRRS